LIVRLLVNVIEDGLKPLARWVGGVILGAWQSVWGVIQLIAGFLAAVFKANVEAVGMAVKGVGGAFDWLFGRAKAAASAIAGVFSSAWKSIAEAFPGPAKFLEKAWNGLVSAAKKTWGKIRDFALAAARKALAAWEKVKRAARSTASKVKGAAKKGVSAAKRLVEGREALSFDAPEFSISGAAPSVAGKGKPPTAAETAGQIKAIGGQAAGVTQNQSVSVGAVNVNVRGSVDMTGPEFQGAVERGATRAVNRATRAAFKDRAQTVTTKPAPQAT